MSLPWDSPYCNWWSDWCVHLVPRGRQDSYVESHLTAGGSPAAATSDRIQKTPWPPSGAATCWAAHQSKMRLSSCRSDTLWPENPACTPRLSTNSASKPAALAPPISSSIESPTCRVSSGDVRSRVKASLKIRGSGFSYPTSAEETITSKYGAMPNSSQKQFRPRCQFEIRPSRRPLSLRAESVSFASANKWKQLDPKISEIA